MSDAFIADIMSNEKIWVANIFLVVFFTTASGYLLRWLLRRLKLHAGKSKTVWDDAAINAADKPLLAFLWVIGLNIAATITVRHTDAGILQYANDIRAILLIVILAWFLIRFVHEVEAQFLNAPAEDGRIDPTSSRAISKLLRTSIVITAALMLLQKLGYSISGVLAFGGIGGIAIGFAAKDLLANFFGGLMIFLDRPFSIGDWVRSPDRNIEGTVEHIGWRLTRIRTFDKRPLYVPNAMFASIAVENPSRMTHRRINETIGVRYDDWLLLPAIVDNIRNMLEQHPGIDSQQTLIVNFDHFNASSLDFFVYSFTKTRDWVEYHQVKQDVLFRIIEIINDTGAEVAFPTQTLHLASAQGLHASTSINDSPLHQPLSSKPT